MAGVIEQVRDYIKDSAHELLYKVTWPTWEELQNSAMIVLVSSIIFSLIIFLMDFTFGANPENGIFKGMLHYVYQIFS
ncbi:MAG: preprotein translocase subunit SecE [Chitinophagales bacterium]